MLRKLFLISLFFLCFSEGMGFAGNIAMLPDFTNKDRVLVFVPHPDDEAIGTAGVIQQALQAGASVKVVLLTCGENNELSFIVYKKRLVLLPADIIRMGELRLRESIAAMKLLGLGEKDVVSLGYPDFGMMEIFAKFWGPVKKPFRAMLSRKNKVSYPSARSPGLTYVGESVLKDLEEVLLDFKPTKVFVTHPADVNRDHRAAYLFLKVALWDIDASMPQPDIYPFLVHVLRWPTPQGYFPEKTLYIPGELLKSDINWSTNVLQPALVAAKNEAVRAYVSQNKYAPTYLVSFIRRNELFGDYPSVPIVRQMSSDVLWQYVGVSNRPDVPRRAHESDQISAISYARQGNNLLVRLQLKRGINKEMGVSVSLFGYKRGASFGAMPKISLIVGLDGFHVKEKKKNVPAHNVQFTSNDKEMIFKVPLVLLGDPDRILGSAKASVYDLTLDETAWRVLVID